MSAPELLAPVPLRQPPTWTWPFDQRVLAGGDRGQRQLRVRRGHAHGLHLGVSEQLVQRIRSASNADFSANSCAKPGKLVTLTMRLRSEP
jgi:hypothetical protein